MFIENLGLEPQRRSGDFGSAAHGCLKYACFADINPAFSDDQWLQLLVYQPFTNTAQRPTIDPGLFFRKDRI